MTGSAERSATSRGMLYAITDRRLYAAGENARCRRLLELTDDWVGNGVAFIQLREKDLPGREQVELARAMLRIVRGTRTRLLLNSRPDVALAARADGVHLPGGAEALTAEEVRAIFAHTGEPSPYVSVSCHTLEEVVRVREQRADVILFAPVFEKVLTGHDGGTLPGAGLDRLRQACRAAAPTPVFALGGVTAGNAAQCLDAGAAGLAAIRLMREPATVWRDLFRS